MANGLSIGPAQEIDFGPLNLTGVDPYDGAQGVVALDPLPAQVAYSAEVTTEITAASVSGITKLASFDVNFTTGVINGDGLPARAGTAVDDAISVEMSDPPPLPVAWTFPWFSGGGSGGEPGQLPIRQHWS